MTTPATPSGPATVEAVAGWLNIPAGHAEMAHVEQVVPAVNSFLTPLHPADAAGEWPAHVRRGAVMLAAKITRERNAPTGVEQFGEFAVQVARRHPQIDELLGLGRHRPLIVG